MVDNPTAEDDYDEALVAELHRLGVRHLVRLRSHVAYPAMPPAELIAALAGHRQARLRGALILLFLRRPSLSAAARDAASTLTGPAADTLRLYYQAAAYLWPELDDDLKRYSDDVALLPDLFSVELGLPALGDIPVEAALAALGERHARLSGRAYNWAGSYRQHLALFLRQLIGYNQGGNSTAEGSSHGSRTNSRSSRPSHGTPGGFVQPSR